MSGLFSRKHDILSKQYQSNGLISINILSPTTSPPIKVLVKRGTKIREMIKNLKTKIATHVTPQVHTANSKEMMAGIHITELHTYKYKEPIPSELLN